MSCSTSSTYTQRFYSSLIKMALDKLCSLCIVLLATMLIFYCYIYECSYIFQSWWSLFGILSSKGYTRSQPSFVIFFADDIGWGDLGANWQPNKDVTPNLNHMASEGIRLTDFHAAASVCTPSRASLLTGRIGLRTGVIENFVPSSVAGLPLNETIIAEVLKTSGYMTGMIGKWHLGITEKYNPRSRGFDYYYGLPYSNDLGCVDTFVYNLPPEAECPKKKSLQGTYTNTTVSTMASALPLFEDYEIIEQPANLINLGDHYVAKASSFLKAAAKADKPFFLYIALAHMHVPLSHAKRFTNSTSLQTVYADTLHEMDDVIGRVITSLKANNLYTNTLTWFTGDNGPWSEKCQFSGSQGPFLGAWQVNKYGGGSTAKATTWEAGHREPTILTWPKHIVPNRVSDALTSTLDIFPTLVSLAGATLPKNRMFDGIDLSSFLKGETNKTHDVLYHPNSRDTFPFGEIDTVRMGRYKIFWKTGGIEKSCDGKVAPQVTHNPPLVFDLAVDPSESIALNQETCTDFNKIITEAKELRQSFLDSVKRDNTSKADFSRSKKVLPCCDPFKFFCRCKKDEA